jgi:hypothetical protein
MEGDVANAADLRLGNHLAPCTFVATPIAHPHRVVNDIVRILVAFLLTYNVCGLFVVAFVEAISVTVTQQCNASVAKGGVSVWTLIPHQRQQSHVADC